MKRRTLVQWLGVGGMAVGGGAVARAAGTAGLGGALLTVREFGAVGDGAALDTASLQAAIEACAAAGGGTVVFPAGRYLSGTIRLRSRVSLWLHSGAVLLGSTRLQDYPPIVPAFRSYTDVNYVERSLLYGEQIEDVAIFGQGIIDGQGGAKSFQLGGGRENYKRRPYLVRLIEGRRLTVRDVMLHNSAMWVLHCLACDDVVLDGVTVHSLVNVNNDGFDLDCCQRVRVANCSITSGDDAIVLKSTAPRPCRAITITNCTLSSRCNAFKCGTESTGGFIDIAVSNCVIEDTRLAALALEMVDGGDLDGISISNIRIRRTGGGVFLRLGNRARPYLAEGPGGSRGTFTAAPGTPVPPVGRLRNVHIAQVTGEGCDITGCALAGLPAHPLENVTLSGIQLGFAGGGTIDDARREVPEQEREYPEYKMFGRLPAFGLWCRHVTGLRLHDVQVGTANPDARPGLVCDDVRRLEVRGWQAASAPAQGGEIVLRNVAEAWVHGGRSVPGVPVYVRVSGANSRSIKVTDNWCPPPTRTVEASGEVSAGSVLE
jgi:hypothetical protein